MSDLAVHGFFMLFAISFLMGLATVFTWVERKQSAITSDRIGANRCYVRIPFTNIKFVAWGLFHGVADGGKLLLKENFTPRTYDRFCYNLAPWLAGVPVLLVFAVIPFGGALIVGERSYVMQIAPLDAGVLFVLAISGIGVLSTMLAGWSSNNKFSLMGAARAASQMISYEVAMGLALISMVVTYGTLDLNAMVQWQSHLLGGVVPAWGIFIQPVAFILFITAGIAENKRIPFDLPECESELVAGYFTEYTAHEDGHVHAERVHRDRGDLGAARDRLPRRLQPALSQRQRLHVPGRRELGIAALGGGGPAGRYVFAEDFPGRLLPDPGALDVAEVSIRPAHGVRLEIPAAARGDQPGRHRVYPFAHVVREA